MSPKSMTGYGRAEGEFEDWSWVWEVRSVNGKSLDMRFRLPAGFESLEPKIRKTVSIALKRGNLQITLTMSAGQSASNYAINHALVDVLLAEGDSLSAKHGLASASVDGLYRVSGVLVEDAGPNAHAPQMKTRNEKILYSLAEMIDALILARRQEGTAMGEVLGQCVVSLDNLTAKARTCEGAILANIKTKLGEKVRELLGEELSPERLAQETALLAVKADVREELDRLEAHITQAKSLLGSNAPIGRKLDFLSQEFIREINTLCSKSIDIEMTQIGLEMKSVVEQFREQAANIE